MTTDALSTTASNTAAKRWWRILVWGGAAALLALPAIAMQFTADVQWTASDFMVMGALLFGLAAIFEFLLRRSEGFAFQLASALALGAAFLLIWVNLAVGIIGETGDPRNLMFLCVIVTALGGAIGAGFRPAGMARAMALAAAVQAVILPVVLTGSAAVDEGAALVRAITIMTVFLTALWLSAAWLFRQAARSAMRSG